MLTVSIVVVMPNEVLSSSRVLLVALAELTSCTPSDADTLLTVDGLSTSNAIPVSLAVSELPLPLRSGRLPPQHEIAGIHLPAVISIGEQAGIGPKSASPDSVVGSCSSGRCCCSRRQLRYSA